MDNPISMLLAEALHDRRAKLAEMTGQEVQQEVGQAAPGAVPGMPPPPPQAPIDPATGQPMAAPPIDPATGQPMAAPPIDPATGQPMAAPPIDPATGQPMDPNAPPPPPPTIEDLLATGDPLIKLLVDVNSKVDVIIQAIKSLMDSNQLQVPASKVLDAAASSEPTAEKPKTPKTSEAPAYLVDDTDPDEDEDKPGLSFSSEPDALKLGSASQPGESGGHVLSTGLYAATSRNDKLARNLRGRRERKF